MIIVVNPGTHPELSHLAAAASATGVKYLTSASWASNSLPQRAVTMKPLARTSVAETFRRRSLPTALLAKDVVRLAGFHEAMFQVARRRGTPAADSLMLARNRRFQAMARGTIERFQPKVLVAQYSAALGPFRARGNHVRVLNYPIAHHSWLAVQERLEEQENATWARFLQRIDLKAELADRLRQQQDLEIAMADAVLVPSEFVRSTFIEAGVKSSKILVSNLGTETVSLNSDTDFNSAGSGPLRVLFAGQVSQRKGISYLLEAISLVPEAQLILVGHLAPGIESVIRRYPRVEIIPSLPKRLLFEQYLAADLLALPSLAEGFPLVAVEAMAHGTAPILTEAAAADDLIEDGVSGFKVRARSVSDIVSVLRSGVADRERIAIAGRAAHQRATRFSWSSYERRTLEMLNRLVSDAARDTSDDGPAAPAREVRT